MVVPQATKPWYLHTLTMALTHFMEAFPAGYQWTGLDLKGPYKNNMYVQNYTY